MGALDGKVAFITGAGRGQGRASALRLADEGADIIALNVAASPLHTLSYELASHSARNVTGIALPIDGVIVTPMAADAPPVFTKLVVDDIPLGRRGTAEDIAPLVLFLISDESAWISGAEIAVDGGQAGHGGMKRLSEPVRVAAEPVQMATTHQEGAP